MLTLLLLLMSEAAVAADAAAAASTMPLELAESVLRNRRVINIRDVIDRQLIYSLKSIRAERFVFTSSGDQLPPTLFATVTPCLTPVAAEFRKLLSGGSLGLGDTRPVRSRSLNGPPEVSNGHQLVSRREVTYKLDTSGAKSLSVLLGVSNATVDGSGVKALVKLSTRYPSIELGSSRYNLQVCDPGSPGLMRVRVSHLLAGSRRLQSLMRICAVANTARALGEFCSAQIGLRNALPRPRQGLLDAVGEFALPEGSFAYNCTRYADLWQEEPTVNVSRLLTADPARIYVNAYLVWPGSDGQAESVSWESAVYYRKDPHTHKRQPMVSCGQQYFAESATNLAEAPGTGGGVFEAAVSVQMPPNTSLLVRPSRLDLVASAYSVEVTPYSGQSRSFAAYAGNFSCHDSVWGYGGVVFGLDRLHACLPGDGDVCRYDSVRLTIRLEHKIKSYNSGGVVRHRYARDSKWTRQPHQFQWQFVHLTNTDRQDVVQPRIGRVEEAITLLQKLLGSANLTRAVTYKSASAVPENHKAKIRRRETAVKMCEVALKAKVFSDSSKRLISDSVKCYKKLLQLNMHVREQCSPNGVSPNHNQPFRVQIASPITSYYTAVYSPAVNSYLCLVFELKLTIKVQIRLGKLWTRYKHLMTLSKQYKKLMRDLEVRLLSTVSTFELPSNANQGFGAGQQGDPRLARPIRHRASREDTVESMSLIYQEQSSPGENSPDFAPDVQKYKTLNRLDSSGHRVFAIYIYAMPSERLRGTKAALSLFAFKLHAYNKRLSFELGCRKQSELRAEWRAMRRQRRQRTRARSRQRSRSWSWH